MEIMGFCFRFQGMGKWELWTEEIKDAPPIPKVSSEFSIQYIYVLSDPVHYWNSLTSNTFRDSRAIEARGWCEVASRENKRVARDYAKSPIECEWELDHISVRLRPCHSSQLFWDTN